MPDSPFDRLDPRYRILIDRSSDGVMVIDSTATILAANGAASRIFGVDRDQMAGRSLSSLVPDADVDRYYEGIESYLNDEIRIPQWYHVRLPGRHENGSELVLELSVGPLGEGEGRFLAVMRDVTRALEAERRLAESEERFRELFEIAPVGLCYIGPDRIITNLNPAAVDLFGCERDEIVGKRLDDLIDSTEVATLENDWVILEARGAIKDREYDLKRSAGDPRHVRASFVARRDAAGVITGVRGAFADITFERRARVDLDQLDRRYRQLFDRNLAGIFRATLDGEIIECNEAYARILGYASRKELLAGTRFDPSLDDAERQQIYRRLRDEKVLSDVEVSVYRKDGAPIWVVENLSLVEADSGDDPLIEGTIFDITAQKLAEERVEYHAYHDQLTGLPNPDIFRERTDTALRKSAGLGLRTALLFVDLDQFKAINDTRGHHIGNQVLQLVAYRLQKTLDPDDLVSRLGGDKFTIVASNLASDHDAEVVAKKVQRTIAQPYAIDGAEIYLTASIGIAMHPDDGPDHAALLPRAEVAMYHAKEIGRNTHVFCVHAGSEEAIERMTIESDLRRALDRGELELYFQPQVDSQSSRIVGVEALVRWNHPEKGLVQPTEFIPVAERSRLIVDVGEWVLREACRTAASWQEISPSLRVAVNLSPRQFIHADFGQVVRSILEETGLDPSLLELEITEGAAMQNPDNALLTLRDLKAMGIRISIDDFGSGYSSLSYLSRFPIDSLKIDQGFVRDIEKEGNDSAIISAVIALAHQLNLTVVAEGVETERQSHFLREQKCEHLQGFLFSHPLPAAQLDLLLREPFGTDT